MQKKGIGILAFSFLVLLEGCDKNLESALKSSEKDYILSKAYTFYNKKKYTEALQLFERAVPLVRGLEEDTKELIYKAAMANYHDKNYILAGHRFNNFYKIYPRDPQAEEALFQSAYCYYLASPDYYLDQDSTYNAIRELQNFINQYPNSQKISQANTLMKKLIKKLERKSFEAAKIYHNIMRYKASLVSFQNFINDYPDSNLKEKASYYMLYAQYELAINSREDLKKDRLEKTVRLYTQFKKAYPNSKRINDTEKIYQKTQQKLKDLSLRTISKHPTEKSS
ncbi:MAG: outer membrane protein assembly factor BamD [Flavobacteriales bacterium AspAUS03]